MFACMHGLTIWCQSFWASVALNMRRAVLTHVLTFTATVRPFHSPCVRNDSSRHGQHHALMECIALSHAWLSLAMRCVHATRDAKRMQGAAKAGGSSARTLYTTPHAPLPRMPLSISLAGSRVFKVLAACQEKWEKDARVQGFRAWGGQACSQVLGTRKAAWRVQDPHLLQGCSSGAHALC